VPTGRHRDLMPGGGEAAGFRGAQGDAGRAAFVVCQPSLQPCHIRLAATAEAGQRCWYVGPLEAEAVDAPVAGVIEAGLPRLAREAACCFAS